MKHIIVMFGFFFVSWNAQAAVTCAQFETFGKKLGRCEDNYMVSKEAMNCVERFDGKIQAGQAKVKKLLDKHVENMRREQAGTYNSADTSYADARKELSRIIAEGNSVKEALASYGDALFLPEDADNSSITGMSADQYINSEPCFATPKRIINGSLDLVKLMNSDLAATEKSAGFKESTSEKYSDRIQVLGEQQPKSQGLGKGAPGKAPLGKKIRGSDISGTEDKKKTKP